MEKSITYFEKEGENYTDELISLVKQRLDESDERLDIFLLLQHQAHQL